MQDYNSQDTTELAKALINVQRQLQPATKDANNPFTKASTLPSTASWTRAVTLCSRTASGFVSIRFLPNRDILGWSRNSLTRSRGNGRRALPWFLCPRPIPKEWAYR